MNGLDIEEDIEDEPEDDMNEPEIKEDVKITDINKNISKIRDEEEDANFAILSLTNYFFPDAFCDSD